MSLQHYKSQLNEVSRHLIGNSVPPNNILIPFRLSSAQKIGYHYWLLMQGSLLTEEGLKYSLDPAQWSNSLAQKLNSNIEFIRFSVEVVILKDKNIDNEKKHGEKSRIVALCVPVNPSSFRNWIFFDYQMALYCQERKAFLFFFFPDSARYSFPSRSFHGETQKAFDLSAALPLGNIGGPVWRQSSAKTVISYLKSF